MSNTLMVFYARMSIYERQSAIVAVQELLVMLLAKGEKLPEELLDWSCVSSICIFSLVENC